MIVVDTNIVAYIFVEGDHTDMARALRRADRDWRLPVFWRYEFLNVLATYARGGGMPQPDADRLWRDASRWCRPMEHAVDMAAALQLAVERSISAYDAQFVALAVSLGVPLITEDARLRRRSPGSTSSLSEFLSGRQPQ